MRAACLVAILLLPGPLCAQFEEKVKPVLATRCAGCHNPEARVSALDVTARDALLQGGKGGPALVPGKPDESRLYQHVASGKMPPDGKLPASDIEAIRAWIAAGATWEGEASLHRKRARAGLGWWSLQPPVKPPGTHSIDSFLLAKLHENGLDFAPPADQRTLIRRLHFAVTGLPPKPEDLNEPYEKAVERLLGSPAYGERWARHWLDVARFGETDGGEHNNERFTAWKYRDWVIGALNADMPYDEFVRMQIAGDVLKPGDVKAAAATGFLVAGPWDSVTKKINRDKLMAMTIRQDELDDMVTASMASFLGLTVGCARCHDHKFDPIPARDYYRITAAFRGVTYGEKEIATEAQREDRKRLAAPVEAEIRRIRGELAKIEDAPRTQLLRERYMDFNRSRAGHPRRIPVNPIWNQELVGPVNGQRFRMVIASHNGKLAKIDRLEMLPASHVIENWSAAEAATPEKPAILEITLPVYWTISEIVWSADGRTGSSDGMPKVYRFEISDDGTNWREIGSSMDHDAGVEVLLPEAAASEIAARIPAPQRDAHGKLLAELQAAQDKLKQIPPLESVHAAAPEPMTPTYVLERGSVGRPGEEVTAGGLSAIRSLPAEWNLAKDADDASRRKALAAWLTDRRNPLLARVMVNRVWGWYFGNGIVNTPSDFGFNGDRPSHPELLDWLAVEFIEHGYSLKWLHRTILHSRAWKQSSQFNEKAHAIDASNRLLWRMPLKRMDAEMLRDSILATAGNLNPERGGPSFLLQKKADAGSYMHKALDNDGPAVWRRAVYRFVVRGGERIFLDSFDCPDPAVQTPQRSVSNTPVQALTLLNNKFVLNQANLLAAKLREAATDPLAAAYERIFQRAPSARERELGGKFIAEHGLPLFLRALWNTNEFVYVP